jgi:hypothetical protein
MNIHEVYNQLTHLMVSFDEANLRMARDENRMAYVKSKLKDICNRMPQSTPNYIKNELRDLRDSIK